MIENLVLKDFRSYSTNTFSFSKKTNIILGKNGAGKTNILEAILVLTSGKSYRAGDSDLIQKNKQTALIKGDFNGKERFILIHKDKGKEFLINNKRLKLRLCLLALSLFQKN